MHWEEKLVFTSDKVSYQKSYYSEVPLINENIARSHTKVISKWSYSLMGSAGDFMDYIHKNEYLADYILNEIQRLLDEQIAIYGCDMDGVRITIKLDDGTKVEYHTDGKLSDLEKITDTCIVKLFKKLIPKGEKKPNFI